MVTVASYSGQVLYLCDCSQLQLLMTVTSDFSQLQLPSAVPSGCSQLQLLMTVHSNFSQLQFPSAVRNLVTVASYSF